MDRARIDDALSSLTRRDLERLREEIDKRLVACTICGSDGAEAVRVTASKRFGTGGGVGATLLICKPCFEKHRLPEGRAGTMDPGGG